jgi:ketosteroid isomerase-like protein
MLMRNALVGVGAATMLLACDPVEAPMTERELVALNDTIVVLMNGYADALMSLDPNAITAFYADEPTFRIYLDGQRISRAELVAQVAEMPSALRSLHAAFEDIEVTPLGRDAALGAARFERTVVDIAGDTLRDWGTATWVWVRRDEGWKVIHGHGVHYPGTLP